LSLERTLAPSDRQRVRDTLARLAARANRELTLSGLVDEWRRFVVAIRQGYNWSMEAYNRDLGIRDLIEEISESLSMEGRRILAEEIRDSDEDFIAATWDPGQPDQAGPPQMEIGWWQFRVPKKPAGKLLKDLEKLGYHDPGRLPEGGQSAISP